MKTIVTNVSKGLAMMLLVFTITAMQAKGSVFSHSRAAKDTTFRTFTGKVIDNTTKKARCICQRISHRKQSGYRNQRRRRICVKGSGN